MMHKIFITLLLSSMTIAVIAQSKSDKTYKVSVSFNSFASGVPDSEPLKKFIIKFKKENKVKRITADHIGPLGREGEYKLAFTLKELTKKQQALFINGLKKVVPEMKDRGSAEMILNDNIILGNLSSRATVTTEQF